MKKDQKRKTVLLTVFSIAAVYFIFIGYQFYKSFSQSLPLTFEIPKEYKQLFLTEYRDKIDSGYTHNYKNRASVSGFDFNRDYNIVVFKLPLAKDKSLPEIVEVSLEQSNTRNGQVYENLDQRYFKLVQISGPQAAVSTIDLKLNGTKLRTVVKNDSVISYGLFFKDFSITTGLSDDVGIFADCEKDDFRTYHPVPVNLLFLKRNKAVYFMLLSSNDLNKRLEYNTLYNLVVSSK